MNATPFQAIPEELTVVVTLAHLLERLERSQVPVGAEQYRTVARRLADALATHQGDAGLHAVLDRHPAAAELYENLHYQHAGLCRSPLEASLAAELRAREVIARARRGARTADGAPPR
jgi:hypothetical protein